MTTLPLIFRLSRRNIFRNTRRTAITVAAMAFSLALIIFFTGFMESYMDQMEDNVIGMSLAHIQIHAEDYRSDQNIHQTLEGVDARLDALSQQGFAAAPRCYGYGLIASDASGRSSGARIKGIDLDAEATVTHLNRESNLFQGAYLTRKTRTEAPPEIKPSEDSDFVDPLAEVLDEPVMTVQAQPLVIGEMVLGRTIATKLGVEPGDTVSIVTMAADGTTGNEVFDVVGIFKNFSEIDDRSLALVTLRDYRRLFHTDENEAHEIAIRIPDNADLLASRDAIEKIARPTDDVATWKEIQPAMAEMQQLQHSSSAIFSLIVYMGAGMLIMNSMLMMVFERIHEFGVMKALGLRPRQLLLLVFAETGWLCLISSAIGVALGIPLILWVGRTGIDLSSIAPGGFAISGTVLDPVLYAKLTPYSVVMPLVTLLVIAFCSVLYPAIKAAVIEAVKAIYHV